MAEYVRDPTTGLLTPWTGRNGTPVRKGAYTADPTSKLITADDTPDFADLYVSDANGLLTPVRNLYGASDVVLDFSCGFFQAGGVQGNKPTALASWTYTADGILAPKVDGRYKTFAANVAPFTDYGFQPFETRTNKCNLENASPTVTTGWSKLGDAAAVFSVVNDADALAAAGLGGIGNGNVYKLDNSTGAGSAWVVDTGISGNTNTHTLSVYARGGAGSVFLEDFSGTLGGFSAAANFTRRSVTTAVNSAARHLAINANAGQIVYFILEGFEEASFAGPPIRTTAGAVTRNAPTACWLDGLNVSGAFILFADAWLPSDDASGNKNLANLSAGADNNNRLFIARQSNGQLTFQANSGGAGVYTAAVALSGAQTSARTAFGYDGANYYASLNGATVGASGAAALPVGTISRLSPAINALASGSLNGGLRRTFVRPGGTVNQSVLNALTA